MRIQDFPILNKTKNSRKLIYLDSASTSLKPKVVIDKVTDFYQNYSANIHRGIYSISEKATDKYENARQKTAKFIGAETEEIIFSKNTTESINLVVKTWGEKNIKKGDKILLSVMEHHSNLLPWMELAKEKSVEIIFMDINNQGELDLFDLDKKLKGVALVAITHVSNVLGTINPIEEIVQKAHKAGALVLVDGAQAAGHIKIDIKKLGCDFYTFSGHKMFGPSGVGVLWMRNEIAEILPPFLLGGGMVSKVTLKDIEYSDIPQKFEAGTPNIEGVIGLGAAIDYINSLGIRKINRTEKELTRYALKKLSKIDGLTIYGSSKNRAGIIAFNIKNIHPHDLASLLDAEGIAIRAGHHCAMPLHQRLGIKSSARISFSVYNSFADIDKLIISLEKVKKKLWI